MVTIMERQFDQQKEHEENVRQLLTHTKDEHRTILEGAKIEYSAVLEGMRKGRIQTRNLITEISQRSSQDYNQLAEMILNNKNEIADGLGNRQKQIQHSEPRRETNLHPHNATMKEESRQKMQQEWNQPYAQGPEASITHRNTPRPVRRAEEENQNSHETPAKTPGLRQNSKYRYPKNTAGEATD